MNISVKRARNFITVNGKYQGFKFKDQKDLKDTDSLNLIKNRYIISSGNKNNWYKLFEILNICESGHLLYKAGFINEGIKKLIMAQNDDDLLVRMRAAKIVRKISKTDRKIIRRRRHQDQCR